MSDLNSDAPTETPPQFEINEGFSFEHAPPKKEGTSPKKKLGYSKQLMEQIPLFNPASLKIGESLSGMQLQESTERLYLVLVGFAREFKRYVGVNYHPKVLFEKVNGLFGNRLEHRDLIFGGLGLLIGGLVGYWLAIALYGRSRAYICMQAIQCFKYSGVEGVIVTDDAVVPKDCGKDEVLVTVKAGAIDAIDINICNGYGSALRRILKKNFKYWRGDLPITLGRSCTGVVVEIGKNVTRLEIGDEVWLTAPFWAPGVLSQHVLSSEGYVAKKPTKLSFESACSLPYAGGLALSTLRVAKITPENAGTKRVLVHGGCSSVGCILIQLLKLWNSKLTLTCYERAVPLTKALGMKDIIQLTVPKDECIKLLKKELDIREPFDSIIITSDCVMNGKEWLSYCREGGVIVSTLPQRLRSDSFGFVMSALFSLYVRSKCLVQNLFWGRVGGFGETQISHVELDKLAEQVEMGNLQTVVEKVFQPYDVEQALTHIEMVDSIGSCVITLR